MTAIFWTGLAYSPAAVLIFTFLTLSSFPGKTSITRPTLHFPLTTVPSCMITTSFTRTFRLSEFHFFLGTRRGKTSRVQRLQNESTIFWTNSTLFLGFFVSRKGPCGTSGDERPNNISLGHRLAPSSGSLVGLPMGRWFTRFATSSKQVYSSNGVRTCSPIAFFSASLQLFTNASAVPF